MFVVRNCVLIIEEVLLDFYVKFLENRGWMFDKEFGKVFLMVSIWFFVIGMFLDWLSLIF